MADNAAQLLAEWLAATPDEEPVLPRVDRSKPIQAGYSQRSMWLAHQIGGAGGAGYVVRHAYRLRGPLNLAALSAAFNCVMARHEVLRSTFAVRDRELIQILNEPVAVELVVRAVPNEQVLRDELAAAAREPLDLEAGPLVRVKVFGVGPEEHVLLVVIHHIVNDAWSMSVMHADLADAYLAATTHGQSPSLPTLPFQYADFAAWQHAEAERGAWDDDVDYWRQYLSGAPLLLNLPTDQPRPPVPSFRGDWLTFEVPPSTGDAVAAYSREISATAFAVLLAAFDIALYRWTAAADLVVGVAVNQRQLSGSERLIGPFATILPQRQQLAETMTFGDVVGGVKKALVSLQRHQAVPFEVLVDHLEIPREPSYPPLVQVVVSSHEGAIAPLALAGLDVSYLPLLDSDSGAQRDLTLYVNAASGAISYAADLFLPDTVSRLVEDVLSVLAVGAVRPSTQLADLSGRVSSAHLLPVVARVWGDVLNRPRVDPGEDFFRLGGTSMAAMQVCSRLSAELGVKVPVRTLFAGSRLSDFVQSLQLMVSRR